MSASSSLTVLDSLYQQTTTSLAQDAPDLLQWLEEQKITTDTIFSSFQHEENLPQTSSVYQRVQSSLKEDEVTSSLEQEEEFSILEKLREITQKPTIQLQKDKELYLEQQVADILGLGVTTELKNHRLPYIAGIAKSLVNIKRSANDTLKKHTSLLEAGISQYRTQFGWLAPTGNLTNEVIKEANFGMSVPLAQLPNWNENYKAYQSWYKNKKVLVVNPFNKMAAIVSIIDSSNQDWHRYQFGLTPTVSRKILAWSPEAQGKLVCFFVEDQELTPGMIDWK